MASEGFHTNGLPARSACGKRFAIVRTDWNNNFTDRLSSSARSALLEYGAGEADIFETTVPGAFELIFAAGSFARRGDYDAVIAIGCVVRGGTPHFDYICQGVTQGLAQINAESATPVVFGVLTVDNYAQAEARCGGTEGDKGREFALTAIKMAQFVSQIGQ